MLPYIIIMDHKERLGELEWSCSVNIMDHMLVGEAKESAALLRIVDWCGSMLSG